MIAARRTFIAPLSLALGLLLAAEAIAAEPAQTPPTDIRQAMLRVWREGISAPEDKQAKNLSQAVRELQSMDQPSSQSQAPAEQAKPEPAPATTIAAPAAAAASAGPATQPADQPAAQQGISSADLAQLKSMEMEKLLDGTGAADALYQAGQYEASLAIYQRLSDHPPAGAEAGKAAGDDWLLFQLANCSARLGRHEEAVKLYQKLIAGFPNSLWVAVAKVQGGLAVWHQAEKPDDLLKQAAAVAGGK